MVKCWLKHKGKMQGHHFQIDKEPLLAIPLCVPVLSEQRKIAGLVKRIIECKERQKIASTDAASEQLHRYAQQYEEQLQDQIENLYGLTADDRQILTDDEHQVFEGQERDLASAEL